MKRFYKQVEWRPSEGGFRLELDGRPVRTPARALLLLPTEALAEAVCDEWRAQAERVDPATMPLTGLANAAIDRIATDRAGYEQAVAAYGESDTLCYQADPDDALFHRQQEEWEPLLAWAERRYDISLTRISGIIHRPQPQPALARLGLAVSALDDFSLTGAVALTGLTGSLVATLAALEGAYSSDQLWQAVNLEENWQANLWGADSEATEKQMKRRGEFDLALKFCNLGLASPREQ